MKGRPPPQKTPPRSQGYGFSTLNSVGILGGESAKKQKKKHTKKKKSVDEREVGLRRANRDCQRYERRRGVEARYGKAEPKRGGNQRGGRKSRKRACPKQLSPHGEEIPETQTFDLVDGTKESRKRGEESSREKGSGRATAVPIKGGHSEAHIRGGTAGFPDVRRANGNVEKERPWGGKSETGMERRPEPLG